MKLIFLVAVCSVTSMAANVTRPTIWFSGPTGGGHLFGTSVVGQTLLLTCPTARLADGLTITYNPPAFIGFPPAVTGLTLICRRFTPIGGTDTTVAPVTMFSGNPGPNDLSTTVECPSGQAMTGIRGRSGAWLDAITIRCATLTPDYSRQVSYTNDPLIGNGFGVPTLAGPTAAIGAPVGGTGGTTFDYDCPANAPFVNALQGYVGTYADAAIGAITDYCSSVLTGLIDTNDIKADFTVRTVGQARAATRGVADGFTVEAFNLGAPVPTFGTGYYVDIVFDSTSIAMVRPSNCAKLADGYFRCTIPNFVTIANGRGAHVTIGNFSYSPTVSPPRPDVPFFAVQASYAVDDSDYSNNTYGFNVLLQP